MPIDGAGRLDASGARRTLPRTVIKLHPAGQRPSDTPARGPPVTRQGGVMSRAVAEPSLPLHRLAAAFRTCAGVALAVAVGCLSATALAAPPKGGAANIAMIGE